MYNVQLESWKLSKEGKHSLRHVWRNQPHVIGKTEPQYFQTVLQHYIILFITTKL